MRNKISCVKSKLGDFFASVYPIPAGATLAAMFITPCLSNWEEGGYPLLRIKWCTYEKIVVSWYDGEDKWFVFIFWAIGTIISMPSSFFRNVAHVVLRKYLFCPLDRDVKLPS